MDELGSFDADIRFMTLNDLASVVSDSSKPKLDDGTVKSVVSCLNDSSLDVQNQAVRVVAGLAKQQSARIILQLVFASDCTDAMKATAANAVFQNAPIVTADLIELIDKFPAVFASIEGIEALYTFASRAKKCNLNLIVPHVLQMARQTSSVASRIWDVLAMVIPAASASDALPVLEQMPMNLALLGLVARSAVAAPWLGALAPAIFVKAQDPQETDDCEAALRALAALAESEEFRQQYFPQLAELVKLCEYSELGESDDGDIGWEDSDSDFFDESNRIRHAATMLSGSLKSANVVPILAVAVQHESSEATKAAMYNIIEGYGCDVASLETCVTQDITSGRSEVALAGIKMFRECGSVPTFLGLVRKAVAKWPAAISTYIMMLNSTNLQSKEDAVFFLTAALNTAQPRSIGATQIVLYALDLVAELQLHELTTSVLELLKPQNEEKLRAAALSALAVLTVTGESNWSQVVSLLTPILQSKPALRVATLRVMQNVLERQLITDDVAKQLVFSIAEVLTGDFDKETVLACLRALDAVSPSYAADVAQAIINIDSKRITDSGEIVNAVQMVLCTRICQPSVTEWAIDNAALGILSQLSSPELVSVALNRRPPSEEASGVHAAAAVQQWQALTEPYEFKTTSFGALNAAQLNVMSVLSKYGVQPAWYTLDQMLADASNEQHGAVIGKFMCNVENAAELMAQIENLELRTAVFTAYGGATTEMMVAHPSLQIASGAVSAIKDRESAQYFVQTFKDDPVFVISTLRNVKVDWLEPAVATLEDYVRDTKLEGSVRADAMAALRWILLHRNDDESKVNLIHMASGLLVPDPSTVCVVNIGPFKHKIDSALPLRLAAVETAFTVTRRQLTKAEEPQNYDEVVDKLVTYSLRDEHEVQVLAFRLISQLAATKEVQSRRDAIFEAMNEVKAPKDTAVKLVAEKHAQLAKAIQDAVTDMSL